MPSASGGSGPMSWKACEPAWRRGWLCTISVSGSTSNLVVLGWLSLICWSGDLNSHQAFKARYDYEHEGPVSDTMLMFQVFYSGTNKKAGLQDALKTMLGVEVSKDEQVSDWFGELTPEMHATSFISTTSGRLCWPRWRRLHI